VNVSAKDKASGKEQTIRIQASGGLTEADIQRLIRDAEAHAEDDRRRKELVEAQNQADATIYTTEKALKEAGNKVPDDVKREAEQAISVIRDAVKGEEVQRIRQALERLSQAASRIGEALSRASTSASSSPQTGADDSGIVDAEFEEVDKPDRKAS
jgi:molecular chaperone DnaK